MEFVVGAVDRRFGGVLDTVYCIVISSCQIYPNQSSAEVPETVLLFCHPNFLVRYVVT